MQDLIMEGDFSQRMFNTSIMFRYTVSSSYVLRADFTLGGRTYTFNMSRWSGRGLSKFLTLFFEYKKRDEKLHGILKVSKNGSEFLMNSKQKLQVILQAARDVLTTIDLFYHVHGRGIVDYCIWYREAHESVETYAKYVTIVACHCVVHSELLAPQITWKLVTFPEAVLGGDGDENEDDSV